jgi:hypothetical protein
MRLNGIDRTNAVAVVGAADGGVDEAVHLGRISVSEVISDSYPDLLVGARACAMER